MWLWLLNVISPDKLFIGLLHVATFLVLCGNVNAAAATKLLCGQIIWFQGALNPVDAGNATSLNTELPTGKIMSLLSYNELVELVETGVITNVDPERINAVSIDLTLGPTILVERCPRSYKSIDLSVKPREYPEFEEIKLTESGFELSPGCFILASSVEVFNLPNNIEAHYYLNSSLARAGLNAALAMLCDPGWHGSTLTLELKNWLRYTALLIRPGMRIGQMVFNRVTSVPEHRSYKSTGSYNNSIGPSVR